MADAPVSAAKAYYDLNCTILCGSCGYAMCPEPLQHFTDAWGRYVRVWYCYYLSGPGQDRKCRQHGVRIEVAPMEAKAHNPAGPRPVAVGEQIASNGWTTETTDWRERQRRD